MELELKLHGHTGREDGGNVAPYELLRALVLTNLVA
jgi:hypothetical protein